MDQYLFNYMCLNHYIAFKKEARAGIKCYFKEIQNINWQFVSRNRAYFKVNDALRLPVANDYIIMKEKVNQFYRKMNQMGVHYLTPNDLYYPNRFKMFEPLSELLFYRGNRALLNDPMTVAVVGTRAPTAYGKKVAYELGRFLGEKGVHVVSGMALGIDGIVHEGVLDVGGKTTAVLASGVNKPYPASHRSIYERIIDNGGLIISENKLDELPMKYHFPMRNRMISGLADVVVIVEASEKSGSLITARYALDQGRLVFAVPGNIYHKNAVGTNRLIYDGAIPLLSFEDIMTSMNWEFKKKFTNTEKCELSENGKRIYDLLLNRKTLKIEELQCFLKVDDGVVNSVIMELILADCCEYVSIDEIRIK
ncbi:DNA-processing protein DprA [Fusibacter ferrireducens]|uniref:DNA-protecting protein DprA n=1 Tax=Fusibacter ferrireducens TaxID=2785058 RepID=A0ABR9ZN21_9FIRM|nr:DNA-processing protein DprA [Fusibacter ferrireducens]MBF4691716.1 DNA-protecting protein DprA [Fusibacter ferrireducens]